MLEILPPLAAALALFAAASVPFLRPEGTLGHSAAFGAIAALGAGVIWRAAPGGELSQWLAALLVCVAAAILFVAAALLRHALNLLGARALFS